MSSKVFEQIFEYVRELEIIDTHEHLPHTEAAREMETDILKEYLRHYFNRDLISAGLKMEDYEKAINHQLDFMERWKLVEPYWDICRHTGYGRALDISVKELYGIEQICSSTIEELNAAFLKSLKPGHFHKVLKEKSKIKVSLLDSLTVELQWDPQFYRGVFRMDDFICPGGLNDVQNMEQKYGQPINSFEDWLEVCQKAFKKAVDAKVAALKCGLSYMRTLKFENVPKSEARDEFNQLLKRKTAHREGDHFRLSKKFEDFMMHYVLELANEEGLAYQFHTGLQEGNGNIIYHSDPTLMSNLFLRYPNVRFDIFHIGYPYQQSLSALAKNFPNVYIDMCWAHIISPTACINALIEWVDSVPINKISAFGGDYCLVDGVYGHQYIARMNVSRSLAYKVEEGVFDVERAKMIAKMLFYYNPMKIFDLEEK